MDINNNFAIEIEYVVSRAVKEGSIPRYHKELCQGKLEINEFAADIITCYDDFISNIDAENNSSSDEDVHAHIADKTGFSIEMIEILLWYYECCQMQNGNVILYADCRKCGSETLYMREDEANMFCVTLECCQCGEIYSLDQIDEDGKEMMLSDVFRLININWRLCYVIETKEILHLHAYLEREYEKIKDTIDMNARISDKKDIVHLPTFEQIDHKNIMTFYVKQCIEDKSVRKKLFDILRNHDYMDKYLSAIKELDLHDEYKSVTDDLYRQLAHRWAAANGIAVDQIVYI